jgi:hypothetical protein
MPNKFGGCEGNRRSLIHSFSCWGWCYIDEEMLDFIGNQTIHVQASSVASSIASRNEKSP